MLKGPLNLQILDLYKSECRDGRIKVVGGDNIEGLLISPEPLALNTCNFTSYCM
ncbi:hypothetical protein RchiOBHm_Chr6g0296391 [Rosa chinensis]|uniref:Uncharacterized protein n=1 Tax=Rosa chinensis TaxID=74649 RepID=A0A2P6PXF5_ROSCH|nr:hypothetical protein RchiOBHm_Chr6g0296391 [Rosa chinensis]